MCNIKEIIAHVANEEDGDGKWDLNIVSHQIKA